MGQAGREAISGLRPEQVAADFDALLHGLAARRRASASIETGTRAEREVA
jgi:hypothetical protein